ncbi:MAG: hypothetical protein WCG98_01670 [bacterium]
MEPQNNDQIITRLLGEQRAPDAKEALLANDSQVLITTSRVVSIRYRVYFLIMLVLVIVFGNYILLPAWDAFQSIRGELQSTNLKVNSFATNKLKMDADKTLISKMESQQATIVSCLNDRV